MRRDTDPEELSPDELDEIERLTKTRENAQEMASEPIREDLSKIRVKGVCPVCEGTLRVWEDGEEVECPRCVTGLI